MQEISPKVYLETELPGVSLGVIDWDHGLVLIDAPFRSEDVRQWRSTLVNLGGGVDRLLINLDSHMDRTMGTRAMDCTVIGHEKMVQAFRNRPTAFKSQNSETGAEWELFDNLISTRWVIPEISFTDSVQINSENCEILLEHKPGPAPDAIWVILPKQSVIFLGDAVVLDQPPFIAQADLELWIEQLKTLLFNPYRNYILVSSRGGLVAKEQVREQIKLLEKIQKMTETQTRKKPGTENIEHIVQLVLKGMDFPAKRSMLYQRRLRWGVQQYLQKVREATEASDR
jgi:glyoxylase-like metal-dependent hydrolase (beta-lactamase superfamily II)